MKVRDVIRLLQQDGWHLARVRGSHRQYKHAWKHGVVTVAGHEGDDRGGNAAQHPEAGRHPMKLLVVIERMSTGFSAYSPDLPGCVATATSRDDVERLMREAIALHLEALDEEGITVPEPTSSATIVEIGGERESPADGGASRGG